MMILSFFKRNCRVKSLCDQMCLLKYSAHLSNCPRRTKPSNFLMAKEKGRTYPIRQDQQMGFMLHSTHGHAKPTASPKAQKLQHSNLCLKNIMWSKLDLHSQDPASPIPAPQKLVLATAPSSTINQQLQHLVHGRSEETFNCLGDFLGQLEHILLNCIFVAQGQLE